ncbi:MAG TPA: glutathione S-transferase family protein [Myxococcales bacterium]|jgi:GST-like protein
MELFYGRMSGNSSRAVFGLNECGVKYDARLVDTQKGENKTGEYRALNPMGKIPAFRDGSFSLWESSAINFYVAEKHAPQLLGSNKAAVLRWCFFQAGHVTPACLPIFRHINEKVKAFWKTEGDAQAAEAGKKELSRYLPVLDEALKGREWLEGTFSLADVAYAPHFHLIREGGFDFSQYANLSKWLDRLLARPAWAAARETVFGG